MTLATLMQSTDWWNGFFTKDGMGWPLLYYATTITVLALFARWAGPLMTDLVRALIAFIGSLDARLGRLESTSIQSHELLKRIVRALEKSHGESMKDEERDQ
jgi:hypothetical protein